MTIGWIGNLCERLAGLATGSLSRGRYDRGESQGVPAPGATAAVRPGRMGNSRGSMKSVLMAAALSSLLLMLTPGLSLSATQGDRIINSAGFTSSSFPAITTSVSVSVIVRTPSTLEFLSYAPTLPGAQPVNVGTSAYRTGSNPAAPYNILPPPLPVGSVTPIDLSQPVPLTPTTVFHGGEPVFVRLTDRDQNLDRTVRETVLVTLTDNLTGNVQVIRILETGPDTGIFAGYIQSTTAASASYSGTLSVRQGSRINGTYTDIVDGSDTSAASVMVDPLGVVFNSQTGAAVDGATVTIINVATGGPATVYGDDGVSSFPSTVVTGSSASDSSGKLYTFAPGGYRFPFVLPGTYQLQVTPPAGYVSPSTATANASWAPYTVTVGSRGETFIINPGPALNIDLPVDPFATSLWVQKTAGKAVVAVGDFLPYEVSVQNNSNSIGAPSVTVTDTLPLGFRYQNGSTRYNGLPAPDPAVSADGRSLVYTIENIPAGMTLRIRYVAAVSAGTLTGSAINVAHASAAGGARSNNARAVVQVVSDFLTTNNILVGRVSDGSCGDGGSPSDDRGIAGARVFLEDGTFVDTDSRGMYHFEGVKQGSHVVQLDIDSLPEGYQAVACEKNSRFAGRAYSQFVDLQGGTLWRTDFRVARREPVSEQVREVTAPPAPEMVQVKGDVALTLKSDLNQAVVSYRAEMQGGAVPVSRLTLDITLPGGVVYLPGSSRAGEKPIADPAVKGSTLSYRIDDQSGNWRQEITFAAAISPAARPEELPTRAVLHFDSPTATGVSTPPAETILRKVKETRMVPLTGLVIQPHFPTFGAELSDEDKAHLDELAILMKFMSVEQIEVIGHTDNVRIAPNSRSLYRDNQALSLARARSVGRHLIQALHLPPSSLTLSGKGESEPVAGNDSEAGRAKNRRVEVKVQAKRVIDGSRLELAKQLSGVQSTAVASLPAPVVQPAPQPPVEPARPEIKEPPPVRKDKGDEAGITEAEGILYPANGTVLVNKINGIRVCLSSGLKPRLLVDGTEVPADRIGFTMKDEKSGKTIYTYIGVNLGEQGEHTVQFQGTDPFGNARFNQTVTIRRSGEIAAIRLKNAEGNLADGKTPVRLQLELIDANGSIIPAAADLSIETGTLKSLKREGEMPEPRVGQFEQVRIDEAGNVLFQPVNNSGLYRVVLSYNNVRLETETYVKPMLRDWILVGLAEGTAGYNTVTGNMVSLTAADGEDKFYEKDRVAFYAKGKIKGEWLLTAAYDSNKTSTTTGSNGLFQTIDPNTYYPLYGDASQQQYDAASSKKIYLKIEREQFYAMYGDFDTGLTITELSRYSRSMTGVKTEYQGKNLEVSAFGSKTGQSYVKDELRGDGTSGMYRLTRPNIVQNSDKITVEVRDRFHSETILKARQLSRFADYSIDYYTGTLFFKEPIANRDDNFNPVFIVVEYETQSGGSESYTYGGRAGVKLLDQNLRAGFSYIHEGAESGNGNSYGVDTTAKLGANTVLHGEMARTETKYGGLSRDGNAYLADVAYKTALLEARLYYRELDSGFGLGQQQASESGTRKTGVETVYKLTNQVTLGALAYRQENLITDLKRDVFEGKTAYSDGTYSANLGFRSASDKMPDGSTNVSNQLTTSASWLTFNKRLTLRAERDQSIGNNKNVDFPTRTIMGADFKLIEAATVFAQQEITSGSNSKTNTTRVGVKSTPWEGAAVNSSVEQDMNENGSRMFSLFGLRQTLKLTEKWSVDGGVERSQTLKNNYKFKLATPPVSGNSSTAEDFTAVSVGSNYREKGWNWDGRVEVRSAKSEERWGFTTSYVASQLENMAWSSRLQFYNSNATALTRTAGDLRFGFVYRPPVTRWILLDRLDILYNRERGGTFSMDNRRVVNNLNANYKPDSRTQISLQYGAKYVFETIDSKDYSGYTDLTGIEGRYDLTKDWDIGVAGRILHSWTVGQYLYSSGASIGYNIVQNAWVSLGYNFTGFSDKDFSAVNYTAQGPYIRFRFKFDQESVKDAISWLNK